MNSVFNRTIFFFAAGLSLFVLVSWYFSNIFIYFTIALVLATILRPMTEYICQTHIFEFKTPRIVAVIFSFLVLLIIVGGFVTLFIPLISEQIQVLTKINYESLYGQLSTPLQSFEHWLIDKRLTNQEEGFIIDNVRANVFNFIGQIEFGRILNNLLSFTGSFFIAVLAVSFITFFLLYEKGLLRKNFLNLIPNQYFEVYIAAIYKVERLLSNYLIGLLIQIFSIFSIASLGLSLLGVKYSLTIALVAALANLIPYAGPILGSSFGILVGVSTGVDLDLSQDLIILVVKIVSVFSIVQLIDNIVLQPWIFSKSVKAHPLEIFLVIFAGATIAGVGGMIAAIPVYTILRVSVIELKEGSSKYYVFKKTRT